VSTEHLVDATISTTWGSGTTGGGFERGHGQELSERATGERRARSADWDDLSPMPRRWRVRRSAWA
jgi:hypothetical protein